MKNSFFVKFYLFSLIASDIQYQQKMKLLIGAENAFKELDKHLKEGTKFYGDLTQLLLKNQGGIQDFCTSRKLEAEELCKALGDSDIKSTVEAPKSAIPQRPPPPANTVPSRPPLPSNLGDSSTPTPAPRSTEASAPGATTAPVYPTQNYPAPGYQPYGYPQQGMPPHGIPPQGMPPQGQPNLPYPVNPYPMPQPYGTQQPQMYGMPQNQQYGAMPPYGSMQQQRPQVNMFGQPIQPQQPYGYPQQPGQQQPPSQ